jgi:sugar lactone lactonase YvrE
VWVSDSGVKMGASGMEPSGSDAVYRIEKGNTVKTVVKSPDLGGPNGLLPAAQGGVWVSTYRAAELYRIDEKGVKHDTNKLPKGTLDGIVQAGDTLLVASWDAATIYRGKPGGTFEPALVGIESPADIGWDGKRSRLLVPVFNQDVVEVYEIK